MLCTKCNRITTNYCARQNTLSIVFKNNIARLCGFKKEQMYLNILSILSWRFIFSLNNCWWCLILCHFNLSIKCIFNRNFIHFCTSIRYPVKNELWIVMSEADDVLLNIKYDDRYIIDKDLVSNVHRLVFIIKIK